MVGVLRDLQAHEPWLADDIGCPVVLGYGSLAKEHHRDGMRFAQGRIPGSTLLPLPELPQRFAELDKNREMVVHCKSGMRSAKAVDFLKQAGFRKVRNMKGGILAWSDKVDPSVPKY